MIDRLARCGGLLWLVLVAASCGPSRAVWKARWDGDYSRLEADARVQFSAARTAMDAGDLLGAREKLVGMAAADPDNLEVAFWLQDLELEILESGALPDGAVMDGLGTGGGGAPEEQVRQLYADRARTSPSVVSHVLAARVEDDAIAAERMLDLALELDPLCSWAHYGRAHALLRQDWKADRWSEAQSSLDEALARDPGHLRARRLQAWMHAQEGATELAALELETWLRETEGDPRVRERDRLAAELDLAASWILLGEAEEALELLSTREGDPLERARRLMLEAVAAQELGRPDEALDAATRAADAAPGEILPNVQQALLLGYGFQRAEDARAKWEQVLESAEGAGDLAGMLEVLRAQVELERLGGGDGE